MIGVLEKEQPWESCMHLETANSVTPLMTLGHLGPGLINERYVTMLLKVCNVTLFYMVKGEEVITH